MSKNMALLAIALNRKLPHGLKVDVIQTELKNGVLTESHLMALGENMFEGEYQFEFRILENGLRANIHHTLATGEKEELQVFIFHTQTLEIPTIQ